MSAPTPTSEETLETRLGRLAAILSGGGWRYDNEADLHRQIAARLHAAGIRCQHEVMLETPEHGRPDFLVGLVPYIALEVKVAGSRSDLLRQVSGYLTSGRVGAALVLTTRAAHQQLPATLHSKLLRVVWVGAALLGGGGGAEAPPVPSVGQLVRTSKGWAVTLAPHAMARFKRCFPRVSDKQYGTVRLDDRRETCRDLLWFMSRYPMQCTELDRLHLEVQAQKFDDQRALVAAVANGTVEPRPFTMAIPPRPYQQRAAEMVLRGGGLLCADMLGLGKTVTGIAALTDPKTRPALVVTQTHLCDQWQRELELFAPQLLTHVIKTGKPYDVCRPKGARKVNGDRFHVPPPGSDRPFPDVLITTYSKVAGWAETLAPWIRGLVLDEVQEIRKGDDTAKGAAIYHLADNADGMRLGLSATVINNYGDEAWAVFRALLPGVLGTREEFLAEWCAGQGAGNHRVLRPSALGSYLIEQGYMVRRTRRDVGRELPPLHVVPMLIEADTKALDKVTRDVAELARAILSTSTAPLIKGQMSRELDAKMRQATGIAKAPYVAGFVRALFEDGAQRVVLAGWHREVYRIWRDLLADFNPVMYTGSENPNRKRQSLEDFKAGKARILIISLRSGAGLDGLQYIDCQDVVHGELDWSPQMHDQLNGRLDRDGQTNSCTAWYLHADQGSDPVVLDVLGVKRQQARGLLDPNNVEEVPEADASHARALARRLLGMDPERQP